MKNLVLGFVLGVAVFTASAAFAAEKTVKLSVPDMFCASCPYMVKQAISAVDGVKAVEATIDDRSATVTYDDAAATLEAIRKATADIGYPSTVFSAEGS